MPKEYEQLKSRFSKTVFKKDSENNQTSALDKAYADMSRRASGHSAGIKKACIGWINDQFTALLKDCKRQGFDFDKWHEKTCEQLVEKFNESDKNKNFGTIGRAQKVINMGFKYLSCIDNRYDALLERCHMTLDGYTLAWYKECVMPWVKRQNREDVKELTEWSKIREYEAYKLIQNNIKDYLEQDSDLKYEIRINDGETDVFTSSSIDLPRNRFDAEFIVWEGEIIKAKYTTIAKDLHHYVDEYREVEAGKEKDEWLIGDRFTKYLIDFVKRL